MTRMARQQLATVRGGVAAVLGPALRTAFEGQLPGASACLGWQRDRPRGANCTPG